MTASAAMRASEVRDLKHQMEELIGSRDSLQKQIHRY